MTRPVAVAEEKSNARCEDEVDNKVKPFCKGSRNGNDAQPNRIKKAQTTSITRLSI